MTATVDELFQMAIAIERATETLYQGLQAKFAHHPEVAAFWGAYAQDEAGHARWLERVCAELTAAQRAQPANPDVLQDARRTLDFSVERALQNLDNLQTAYQLAYDLENAETNAIFEFLITNFSLAQKSRAFLQIQLRSHINKITDEFPVQYRDVASRREVEALP